MIVRKVMGVGLIAAIAASAGCASIVGDSKYPVLVSSAPLGAAFEITNKAGRIVQSGSTPATIVLKSGRGYFKGETYTLRFKKGGYPEQVTVLNSRLSGWYWGNIVFGGLIGMLIVDPLTGAMFKLPESATADFGRPVAAASLFDLQVVSTDSH